MTDRGILRVAIEFAGIHDVDLRHLQLNCQIEPRLAGNPARRCNEASPLDHGVGATVRREQPRLFRVDQSGSPPFAFFRLGNIADAARLPQGLGKFVDEPGLFGRGDRPVGALAGGRRGRSAGRSDGRSSPSRPGNPHTRAFPLRYDPLAALGKIRVQDLKPAAGSGGEPGNTAALWGEVSIRLAKADVYTPLSF